MFRDNEGIMLKGRLSIKSWTGYRDWIINKSFTIELHVSKTQSTLWCCALANNPDKLLIHHSPNSVVYATYTLSYYCTSQGIKAPTIYKRR